MRRLAALLVFAAACAKPAAGHPCKKDGQQACADERDALVCVEGKWETLACRGPAGCKSAGDDVACDNDAFSPGDPCVSARNDYACGADKVSVVRCVGEHWKLAGKCPGPKGCSSQRQKVSCDDSLADLGMPCATEGSGACSGDKKTVLRCEHGVMAEAAKCRGARGCSIAGSPPAPVCDTTIAQVGDACQSDDEAACSVDGKQFLRCRDHVMTAMQACAKGCEVTRPDGAREIDCR